MTQHSSDDDGMEKSMRDIKFRFYSTRLKKFVTPDDSIFVGALKDAHMNPQQFTGLTDRNGVEIYEGDIVEYYSGELARSPYWTKAVEWRSDSRLVGFNLGRRQSSSSYHILIGNIYDNPELLEKEEYGSKH